MFPRSLTLFRAPNASQNLGVVESFLIRNEDGLTPLAAHPLFPVGGLEMTSVGFVPPNHEPGSYVEELQSCYWFALGSETKILPASTVNAATARKVAEIEEEQGRRLGGRAYKRVRDEVLQDLMPRALSRPGRVQGFYDYLTGVVMIDTASRKAAEGVLSELRKALGSCPAWPVNPEIAPRGILTGWLAGQPLPPGLALGDECLLLDPMDKGARIRCTRQELTGDEIAQHLEAGKQCAQLQLTLDERLNFVLGDDLAIRKLRFLDAAVESIPDEERETARLEGLARFALTVGELRRLFCVLADAFQISDWEG